ncbi:serine hydrolase [Planomonospora sp. ID82291]|uniref:serine hydrolase domain-containing protein n=1 Tax=Planomonospora sp. ID82291 TaxID=2738136 RepID=UPI0018C40838|nr:serine hydrolase domain-containing protein [Planomonospora sp. ID82291]MBG0817135.1 beta-lactamase family protein [Planomonospora sp. ID82291]
MSIRTVLAAACAGSAVLTALVALPAAASTSSPPCSAVRARLQHELDAAVGQQAAPGFAASVTSPRCGTWRLAAGTARRETGARMRGDERFRIGSVSKTFTAVVVLQLAAEGRLDLDAPLTDYLPRFELEPEITLRRVLRHDSRLGDYAETIDQLALRFTTVEPEKLVAAGLAMPRTEGWAYSSTGTVLAALAAEEVTGQDIGRLITRRIIKPLKLTGTYWPGTAVDVAGRHADGYVLDEGAYHNATRFTPSIGHAAGALISTPQDLDRFYGALLGGRLLPAGRLAEMRATIPADPERMWPGAQAGLGLFRTALPCGGDWWGHGGGFVGYRTLAGATDDGRRVALAANQHPGDAKTVQLEVLPRLLCALK